MSPNRFWDFGDEVDVGPLAEPGQPKCYHCSAPVPEGIPDPGARCEVCHFHLHTCPNCILYDGIGCLILSPYMWGESSIMGQDCPYFQWRQERPLTPEEVAEIRAILDIPAEPPATGDEK